jgi:hypothetical protein
MKERYMKDPKTQRLLVEHRNGKKHKELRLVDGLIKYKQSWIYMLQQKLMLLVLKEEHDSPIGGHRGKRPS